MIHQSTNRSHQMISRQYTFNSRLSEFREYMSRRRLWLTGLALFFCSIVVGGIVLTIHIYYEHLPSDFFKSDYDRTEGLAQEALAVFLPLRKIEIRDHNWAKRVLGNIPFYACGDQQQSCAAFDQPNICCPVGTACFASQNTPSQVLCCNATSLYQCQDTSNSPPKCLSGTTQCSAETGGGCCPDHTVCSPNGCIQITGPSIINSTATETAMPTSTSTTTLFSTITTQGESNMPAPVTITRTVTQIPAATATIVKQGEVAQQKGTGGKTILLSSELPYLTLWALIGVAFVMGLL
ncbi:hypothetical protein BGZ60DRAFT_522504 [Tricladium varicosporioides]|nr:hypothetical protein BGZ60DRAFT_522504 [Hymenoscyphus varicosporioides]